MILCLRMYVRMYACMYVHMCVCTYVCMYVCTCVYMCVCVYVRMYVCTHLRTYAVVYCLLVPVLIVSGYFGKFLMLVSWVCSYVRTYVQYVHTYSRTSQ